MTPGPPAPPRPADPAARRVALRGIPRPLPVWTLILAGTLAGCEEVEQIVDRRRDLTPHEAYAASLEDAGLAGTALGRAWTEAAEGALAEPVRVDPPFREQGWMPPEHPTAVGYAMDLERGQVLTVSVELEGAAASGAEAGTDSVTAASRADSTRLFVDLFRVPADPGDPLRPVQEADSVAPGRFSYEPWRDGAYVLRVQPELLRGGRYRVTLSLAPALAFPVEGRGVEAIQSFFGAPRDGGSRDHHGVDIFAPRGTPVVAVSDGTVRRANETPIGGRVVWLRDARRPQSIYYAHLDSQVVRRGQRVRVGDTLGFVGNSGNARTTPPHLHFGLYQRDRGPVDPLDWVRPVGRSLPSLPGDPARLGAWVRTTTSGARLRAGPDGDAPVTAELGESTAVRVLGGTEGWWRVRLPDGRAGYLSAGATGAWEDPVVLDRAMAPLATGSSRPSPRPGSPPAPPR